MYICCYVNYKFLCQKVSKMLIFMFVLTFLHKKVNLHGVADAPAQLEKFVPTFLHKNVQFT